jgi:hypothetical protein
MRQAFWTVKDGQVVTAHVNREGVEVDHRPPSALVEDMTAGRFTLELRPCRGVEVAPLLLEATVRSQPHPDQSHAPAGRIRLEHSIEAHYMGVTVSKTWVGSPYGLPYYQDAPGEEAAALRAMAAQAIKEEMAQDEAIRRRQEARVAQVKAQVDGLVTARDGKALLCLLSLDKDVKSLAMSDVKAVEAAVLRANARPQGLCWRDDEPLGYLVKEVIRRRRDSAAVYALLLETARSLLLEERAAKKAAWLASKASA